MENTRGVRRGLWRPRSAVPLLLALMAAALGISSIRSDDPSTADRDAGPRAAPFAVGGLPARAGSGPPATSGWGEPVFFDGFDDTALNLEKWFTYESAKEPKRDPNLVRVAGGELALVGSVNAAGQEVGSGVASRFGQKYGRWEVRFRIDKGAGYGPAILLWPDGEGRWPGDGEIDLVEVPKAARSWGTTVAHNGSPDQSRSERVTADFTQWHTVAVDWLPDLLTFYLDGKKVWTVTPETKPYQGGKRNLVPSTSPMRLALQLDECSHSLPLYGPDWIPCRNKQTPPEVLLHIDWVKVYKAP